MFALLAMLLVGVNVSWADDLNASYSYLLPNGKYVNGNAYQWYGSTNNTMTLFKNLNGSLSSYTTMEFNAVGCDEGERYRILFMNGSTAVKTLYYGGPNEPSGNGTPIKIILSTVGVNLSEITEIRIGGDSAPAADSFHEIGFWGAKLTQTPHYSVSINSSALPSGCDAWYTIGSDATKYKDTQWLPVGTKVTFTMSSTNEHRTPAGWRTEGWNSTHDKGWMGYDASFTTTLRTNAEDVSLDGCSHDYSLHEKLLHGNLNPAPEFNQLSNYKIRYNANGATGDVPVDNIDYALNASATVLAPLSLAYSDQWGGTYTFGWWSTNPEGTGQHYYEIGKESTTNTITVSDDITLYAIMRTDPVFTLPSAIVIPTGTTELSSTFKVRGDGVVSVKVEKTLKGTDNWTECNASNDLYATVNTSDKLPGYGADRSAVFSNFDKIDESYDYRLAVYQTDGIKYRWAKRTIPLFLNKPVGYNLINVTYDGQTKEREFLLHVPAGASGRVPVLFSLHGTNCDYDSDGGVANYNDLADGEKFIVVYPRGLDTRFPGWPGNHRGWLSTGQYNEDVKFFEDIIDYLDHNYLIDKDRIYMTGFSNGGMMTYSTAFTSEKFAGFAAVSGYQLNEFHLQHYGALSAGDWKHPVPFMHIHGTNDDVVAKAHIQPIIDNMVYRNGCNPWPEIKYINAKGASSPYPATSKATKFTFAAAEGAYPFVYYEVDGMHHNPTCRIDEEDNGPDWDDASQTLIWNFLSQYSLPHPAYNTRCRIEFMPKVENDKVIPQDHGWKIDLENNILLQYGEKPGECKHSGSNNSNVYHSLQLGPGWHNIRFKASSTVANTSTMSVTVKLEKLGTLGENPSGNNSTYTPDEKTVFEKTYNLGDVAFNVNITDAGIGEYRLTYYWNNSDATDRGIANGKAIKISGISIINGADVTMGSEHFDNPNSDFGGYFRYRSRLMAQWNFDLCDGARFNRESLGSNWTVTDEGYGLYTYTYNQALSGQQLTYGDAKNTIIPNTAGLVFTAPANTIKMQVYVENGALVRTQLVLEPGVNITVPYVRNSFRNDQGNNGSTKTQYTDYMDCLHHINRDILYVSSSPNFFDVIENAVMPYTNDSDNGQNNFMFHSGGPEAMTGNKVVIPDWQKLNYCGYQGGPCVITIKREVTIDRIGVNRNLINSFYTENIASDLNMARPFPGLRYIGTPQGSKIESEGLYSSYNNAIAMTFGGWEYNDNEYDIPVGDDGKKRNIDSWEELNVYHGEEVGEGNQNYNIGKIDVTQVPVATDGFPVYSMMKNPAYNENVNPEATDDEFDKDNLSYHDKNYGRFYLSTVDDGTYSYVENLTPWSLPTRGAYVKFEPTIPGVLNVHILQEADEVYYIADEFGKLVKTNVFAKTGTGNEVKLKNDKPGHFYVEQKDNVKYVFDVYPGKSYYIFSNDKGFGFTGYYFEPYVFMKGGNNEIERDDVGIKTATIREGGYTGPASLEWDNTAYSYTNQTAANPSYGMKDGVVVNYEKTSISDYENKYKDKDYYQPITYSNKAVHITCDRQFSKDTWGTICLPYSMNHLQLEDVFGAGAKVVLMRDVQEVGKNGYNKTTINFIYHQNQDIIAGYPYLVYPTKNVSSVVSNAYLAETAPSIVSINGIGQNTVTHPGSADYKTNSAYNYDGLPCFEFKGNFTPESLGENSYVIATNGNLTRLAKTQTAAPFRAYVKYIGEPTSSAKPRIQAMNIGGVNGEDEDVVAIEDILLESGIVGAKTNVYSVNGTLIRQNTDDLRDLPKGVYIVNGKKYLVK
ncbi:MAG: prolyl oligopeptidase family serine peptidase [Prevotellaceae bacterium]|nr:prolyl oligopeptidase family serine peptidase [Candidatus Minthosoma caballi]